MRAGTISQLSVPILINNMPNPILFSIMEPFEPFWFKTLNTHVKLIRIEARGSGDAIYRFFYI